MNGTAAIPYLPPDWHQTMTEDRPEYAAWRLWQTSEDRHNAADIAPLFFPLRRLAWRQAETAWPVAQSQMIGAMRWRLGVWTQPERWEFCENAKKFWWAQQKLHLFWRQRANLPTSPNVYETSQQWQEKHGSDYVLTQYPYRGDRHFIVALEAAAFVFAGSVCFRPACF
ncbi:MAG: hypothetical protein NTX50_32555 [Candidatus Sumerlaeota bacterium]|nr:hypothetical protein [Candidatus Sumerlaeota bacterium]